MEYAEEESSLLSITTTLSPSASPSVSVSPTPSNSYSMLANYISSLINKNLAVNDFAYKQLIDEAYTREYIYTDYLNNLNHDSEVSPKFNFAKNCLNHTHDYDIKGDEDDRPYAIYIIPNGYSVKHISGSDALSSDNFLFETSKYKVYGERTYRIVDVNIYKD